jgi:hypothetical protein
MTTYDSTPELPGILGQVAVSCAQRMTLQRRRWRLQRCCLPARTCKDAAHLLYRHAVLCTLYLSVYAQVLQIAAHLLYRHAVLCTLYLSVYAQVLQISCLNASLTKGLCTCTGAGHHQHGRAVVCPFAYFVHAQVLQITYTAMQSCAPFVSLYVYTCIAMPQCSDQHTHASIIVHQ